MKRKKVQKQDLEEAQKHAINFNTDLQNKTKTKSKKSINL